MSVKLLLKLIEEEEKQGKVIKAISSEAGEF